MGKRKKTIGKNAVVNGVKTAVSVVFPLITYPYITRVLGVENVGIYTFSFTLYTYFSLLAALGIQTYGIREGARFRSERAEFSRFASEVFTINLVSTLFAYILMALLFWQAEPLHPYVSTTLVLCIGILFTTLGCDWIFSVYEEYFYITVRTLAFQALALVLLFLLVKHKEDVNKYALVIMLSSTGAGVVNALGIRRYCNLRLVFNKKMLRHIAPVLILFANSVATLIYVNSDITVLGLLSNDYHVGIYSIASKIYSVFKQILSAVIIVSVPRLSAFWGKGDKEAFRILASRIIGVLMMVVLPFSIGVLSLRKEIILIISTKDFLLAERPLAILAAALVCCLFNWFLVSCILIPTQNEKVVLRATILSAAINLGLNFVLIPHLWESAAAITTLIAEAVSLAVCWKASRKVFRPVLGKRDVFSVVLGTICVWAYCFAVRRVGHLTGALYIICAVCGSLLLYSLIMAFMHNTVFLGLLHRLKRNSN